MFFYSKQGTTEQIVSDTPLNDLALIEMQSARPGDRYISQADGTWLYSCSNCCAYYCGKVEEIKATKYAANAFEWPASSGQFWQTEAKYQSYVNARATRAAAVVNAVAGVTWSTNYQTYRDKENADYTFSTAADFVPFAVAYDDYCVGIAVQATVYKDALMAINNGAGTDAEKIAAMDSYYTTTILAW